MWLEGETHVDLDYVSRAEDRKERIKIGFDEVNLNGNLNGSVSFFQCGQLQATADFVKPR